MSERVSERAAFFLMVGWVDGDGDGDWDGDGEGWYMY